MSSKILVTTEKEEEEEKKSKSSTWVKSIQSRHKNLGFIVQTLGSSRVIWNKSQFSKGASKLKLTTLDLCSLLAT
jgi:hypothetical protein